MLKTKNFSTFTPTLLATACLLAISASAHSAVLKTTTNKTGTTKTATTKTTPTKKTVEKTTVTEETVKPVALALPTTVVAINVAEPSMTAITYPKYNAVTWQGTDISAQNLTNVPIPTMRISDVRMLPTVVIPQDTQGSARIDVSVLDDFIAYVSPMARHYPPVFVNRTDRYNATQRVKQFSAWIDEYAKQPNASYDVLLRAAKINAIARNLDLGSDYAVRASTYVSRAIQLNDTAEANFLYGAMLAEGGGFAEGSKYLEKAEKMGYAEATQSLAQADLLDDKKERAIQRLNDFKAKYPNDPYIDEQLRIVNSGQYYIWNIPAPTKP